MINVKSNYSLLSSMLKIDDIINYYKSLKKDYAVISDTNMYATMAFYNKCLENKIKPIIGLNINMEDIRINIYAKDYTGYQSMIKLSTIQNERVVTIDDLSKYNKNLITVLYFNSREKYKELTKIFDELYLGYSNKEEEKIALSFTNNVVFFRECLYKENSDKEYLSYLYLIRDGKTISDDIIYDIENHELVVDDINLYTDNKGLVNIESIVSKCNLIFPPSKNLLPIYHPSEDIDSKSYLYLLAQKGLSKRLNGNITEEYQKRLNYELKVIDEMGFCNYFLVVYDFILYAKKNDILVGPGRGSAAGSLVAYALGITEIDPIKYDLLFERFLNPERKTMPDIDTDFPDDRRYEVIEYVKEKYGEKHVAGIVTFGTLAAKQVLRDTARILNIPVYKVDSLTKLIPAMSKDKLEDIYNKNINFRTRIDSDTTLTKLYKIAKKFEGSPRHTSSHAAGIVMCEIELDKVLPLTVNDGMYLTSYSMEYLEDLGLLKMDFLGLKNLSIISNIIKDIETTYNKKINFYDIDLNDNKVIKIFETANTTGIFQFESDGMRSFLKRLKPNNFEDIFAAIALFRPGPAMNIDTYIRRKHGQEEVTYYDKSLEKVLKNTYGIFIYQEQIMQVASIYANYSLGEADILRRAMSKKKFELLKGEEEKFIKKSIENNHSYEDAKKIFDLILNFAGYGFNRSHSVAYSMIAYRLAYFKVYYKEIFYSNLLSNVINSSSKTHEYIIEIRKEGLNISKPDINISTSKYLVKDNNIYLPFSVIKDVGLVASKNILEARRNGIFVDIYDCISRLVISGVGKKTLESLIYIGALNTFGYNIKTLINNLDNLINYGNLTKDLDPSLVMKPVITEYEEFDKDVLLEEERNLLGFYLTNHPTTKYLEDNKDIILLKDLSKYLNKNVNTLVLVEKIKTIKTKKGEDMAFITVSDEISSTSFTLFPKTYNKYNYIEPGNIIKAFGKVEKRLNELQVIIDKIDVLNGENNE